MDYQKFIQNLPNLYHNWGQPSITPKNSEFQTVLSQIQGMTTANIMQVLNFAVECLPEAEIYCEIGCFQGASLIGALLNYPDKIGYAVDDFSQFDDWGENLAKLTQNLLDFNLDDQVIFCEQNFIDFFQELSEIELSEKVGVYHYDAASDYRSQMLGLLLIQPFLADQALIFISNANDFSVQQAVSDIVNSKSELKLISNFTTNQPFAEDFWNGLLILIWDKTSSFIPPLLSGVRRDQTLLTGVIDAQKNLEVHLKQLLIKAEVLVKIGNNQEAEKNYNQVLLYQKNNAEAWLGLGTVYFQTEKYHQAISSLLTSLNLNFNNAETHYILGLTFEKLNQFNQALSAYNTAINLDPSHNKAYNNLGNLYLQLGQIEAAKAIYFLCIKKIPQEFGAYLNLGNALMSEKQWDQAIIVYHKALELKPNYSDIFHNLAIAYQAKSEMKLTQQYFAYAHYLDRNYQESIKYFCQLFTNPENITANDYLYFSIALNSSNSISDKQESILIIQEGIKQYPTLINYYYTLVNNLLQGGQVEEADQMAEDGLKLHPDDLFLSMIKDLMLPCLYETPEQIITYRERFAQGLGKIIKTIPLKTDQDCDIALSAINQIYSHFFLSYQGYNNTDLQQQYGQLVEKIVTAKYPAWVKSLTIPPLTKDGKIKIGYLSDQLGNSSASKWLLGWLENCDRSRFEIYCYHTSARSPLEGVAESIKLLSDHFRYIPDNLEATYRQVYADQLHILVFLAIGLWNPTTQLAALRIAPIQCTTWGHPVTSGLSTIDYFLSGELLEIEQAQEHYTEQLVRLPNLGISYPKPFITEPAKTRADFGFKEDDIIYISCQIAFKYLPQHDYIFAEIAHQIPQAKIVFIFRSNEYLKADSILEKKFRNRLEKAFNQVNLNYQDHCVFLPGQDWQGYTSLLQCVDVFLDTLEFSGGHTSFDAVACNLPIVTCPSQLMRGRQTYSILKMLQITDTIAKNETEYINIAVKLGLDDQYKQEICQKMSQNHHLLFNDQKAVQGLETWYQKIVHNELEKIDNQPTTLWETIADKVQKIVLHVGCGYQQKIGLNDVFPDNQWQEIRLDIDPQVVPDIIGSITDLSAIPDNSVDAVYSSHNLEHLEFHLVLPALKEFYRVIKPKGFTLITLPDIQKVAEFVAEGKLEETLYVSPAGPIAPIDILYGLRTAIANGNHYMAHRTAFTKDTLSQKLEQIGFIDLKVTQENYNLWITGFKG